MSKLKPCICGGKAELQSKYLYSNIGWGKSYFSYHVECTNCGKKGIYFNTIDSPFETEELAIEEWNTRVGEHK